MCDGAPSMGAIDMHGRAKDRLAAGVTGLTRLRQRATVMAVIAAVGCSHSTDQPPTGPRSRDARAMVTPIVAAGMTRDGQFNFAAAPLSLDAGMITADTAVLLATQYLRVFGKYLLNPIEPLRGERVDLTRLSPGASPSLAETPIQLPPEDGGGPLRKTLGSYYHVDFFDTISRERILSVGVSAFASDIHFTSEGLVADGPFGNEFRVWVTPRGSAGEPRMTAEEAVTRVFTTLGRRAASVPRFVRIDPNIAPQIGRWRIDLESPIDVTVSTTGERRSTNVVYVDRVGAIQIPASRPRQSLPAQYVSLLTRERRSANIAVRSGFDIEFVNLRAR